MNKNKVLIAVLVAVLLFSGSMFAFVQADGGLIQACVNTHSGTIKIVSADEDCRRGWVSLSWNQTGPQGPAGPQGEQGPAGPQGVPGPAGPVQARSGAIGQNGAILAGSGFTVTKPGTGIYQIRFTPGIFTGFPIPTVTTFDNNAQMPAIQLVLAGAVSGFDVTYPVNTQFTFVALDSNIGAATTTTFGEEGLQETVLDAITTP